MSTKTKMKAVYNFIALVLLLTSCHDEEGKKISSEYVILNEVDSESNMALYDYSTKTFTERFHQIGSIYTDRVNGAAKKENYVYVNTGYYDSKLRKIDVSSGAETAEVESWVDSTPFIDFHDTGVVVCHAGYSYEHDKYLGHVKFYDENLSLQDSIAEIDMFQMDAVALANNRLFCSVAIVDKGFFIRVMDLTSRTFIDSTEISSICQRLIPLDQNHLLGIKNNGYFIMDTQSLEITTDEPLGMEADGVALDAASNILYFLYPVAQPALVPYQLKQLNLSTGMTTQVTTYPESILKPILFDDEAKVIVSGGGLKIFSRDGKVLEDVAAPATTKYLFIK
jgi:hypothetical protein